MAEVYYTEYKGWYCDTAGEAVNVELKRRYTIDPNSPIQLEPEIKELIFAGHEDEPVKIDYPQGSITTKLNPINGSECLIGIKAIDDFELSELYTSDEKEWLVLITGARTWQGFLVPDECEEPFKAKPYDVRVSANDALGTLDEIPFTMDDGTRYRGFISDLAVIRICLEKTGLSLPFTIGVNTSVIGNRGATDPNKCLLAQMYLDASRFLDEDGVPFSCKEVLRSVLERNSARLHQVDGRWCVVNVLELAYGTVKGWLFDGNLNPNGTVPNMLNAITAGGLNREVQPVGNITLQKAFLNSTAYYQYGFPVNKLANGDMNLWTNKPAGLPDNWATFGGVTAVGKVRQVNGQDTTDYLIEMSGQVDGNICNTQSTFIQANQKSIVSFDIYSPEAQGIEGSGDEIFELKILVQSEDGQWFGNNGWQSTSTLYRVTYRLRDLINQIRVSFEVLARAVDYRVVVGVTQFQTIGGSRNIITQVNNFDLQQKEDNELTKIAIGEYVRQTSLAKQTYKPDPILLLHADEPILDRTSRLSIGLPSPTVNVPIQWSRANIPGEGKELQMIVSNTSLRIHSRPYRVFQADFYGVLNIDPNTVLTTDLLPGTYMFLSGSFDLKTNIHNLRFAEILKDDIPFIQEQKQDYGTENNKNGIDVANPVGVSNVGQIQYDPSLFVQLGQQTLPATNIETQGEIKPDAYVSPFTLGNWWSNKKTQDQTLLGQWNFLSGLLSNGEEVLTSADVVNPATDQETQDGVVTNRYVAPFTLASWWTWIKTRAQTITGIWRFNANVGINIAPTEALHVSGNVRVAGTYIITQGGIMSSPVANTLAWTVNSIERMRLQTDGRLTVAGAPTGVTDVVRLQELNNFRGSDKVLSKTAAYTIVLADFGYNGNVTIYVDTTAGNINVTLPTAAIMNGYTANIIKTSADTNSVTVVATINGLTNDILSNRYSAGTYKSNGTAIFKF